MLCFQRRILALVLVLSVLHTCQVHAQPNGSTFYLSHNLTVRNGHAAAARHYAILNASKSILATIPKYQNIYNDTTTTEIPELEDVDVSYDLEAPGFKNHLMRSSVIFGLTTLANESNVNPTCNRHLQQIQRAILRKEPWAMKVLDASGTKPSGFMFGQNFWLGSQQACGAVQKPVGITLHKIYPRVMNFAILTELAPFEMDYRVVYLRHNSPWQVEIKLMSEQIIHIGICLPSACSSREVQQLTTKYMSEGRFVESEIYDLRAQVLYTKELKLSDSFYEKMTLKLMSVVMIFTTLMIAAASWLRVKPLAKAEAMEKSTQITTTTATTITPATLTSAKQPEMGATTPEPAKIDDSFLGSLKSFVKCYDLQSNCERMFVVKESTANQIPVINGLRSVCAMWIMIFHVVWFMYFTVNNKTFLVSYAEQVFFQYVSSAPLLVDVFFTISGFLQTYNFLRNAKQIEIVRQNSLGKNVKLFFKMLFHRYLRLAPLYLVIICAVDLFYAYIADVSVYHINERFDQICSNNWWRNLLFIQNFWDHTDMCLNWSWSLACEMQYFVIATILLFIYAKHPKFVKLTTIAALFATMIWTFCVGLGLKFQLSFDSAFATGTEIYISPFVRILPYIVGSITAWYLLEKHAEIDLTELKEKCLWNLAILIFFCCIFSTIKRDMGYVLSISLFVIGRLFFSLCVCWMIVGSATGRGSWWSRILEAKAFQHVNRLSYAIYLLNPFVISIFFSLTSASTHADPFMLCVLTSGFAVINYLASIVFSLVFEMPYSNWSSLMLRRQRAKAKCD